MARSSNEDLTLKVGFDIDKFQAELRKTNNTLSNWAGGVQKSVLGLAGAFSALALGRFVMDVSRLAGEAEGVNAAFMKLENSAKLMQDLKKATGGTVSELELMKRSVMASNFDISLKALPQLLEFATLRARQTGQSVDYLVDSIVTGIGRKSKLILDNLGISAVQLTEALGGASAASSTIGEVAEAVGKIASENLVKMGKLTDDAAVRADRLAASWANLKVQLGTAANYSGLSFMIEKLGEFVGMMNVMGGGKGRDPMGSLKIGIEAFNKISKDLDKDKFLEWISTLNNLAKEAGVELVRMTDAATGVTKILMRNNPVNFIDGTKIKDQVRNVKFLKDAITSLNEEIDMSASASEIAKLQGEIKALETEMAKLLGTWRATVTLPAIKPGVFNNPAFKSPSVPHTYQADIQALRDLQTTGEEVTETVSDMSEEWARFGNIVGESIGDLINGTQSFGQAMAQMASRVIDSLFQMALANAAFLASKFGPAAPFIFAVSAGILKSIFSNIGQGNRTTGMTTATGRAYTGGDMNHLRISLVGQAGKYLQTQLVMESNRSSRSKA